jgi:tryptophan synthase alpha chain
MNRIQKTFEQAAAEGRACFVAYLCAGDPDFETSLAACREVLESGADILELGVPYSDPLADGMTNQLAAQRALEAGATHQRGLDLVRAIREFSDAPIVFYTYYNLVFSRGSDVYAREAKEAGVDGLLTLDLPPEEASGHLAACEAVDMKTVCIVAPTTTAERLPLITRSATGFIYYVSREGVTGEQSSLADDLAARMETIRAHTDLPVVVGFGVSKREHVAAIAQVADGVVVGSALVNCIAANLGDAKTIKHALGERMQALLADKALAK